MGKEFRSKNRAWFFGYSLRTIALPISFSFSPASKEYEVTVLCFWITYVRIHHNLTLRESTRRRKGRF